MGIIKFRKIILINMTTEFTTMVTDQWNQFNDNGGYVKFMDCKF